MRAGLGNVKVYSPSIPIKGLSNTPELEKPWADSWSQYGWDPLRRFRGHKHVGPRLTARILIERNQPPSGRSKVF
ncbi:MAG: hypothetical protein SGI77_00640 [Pirellulaceae bacterium]|nr:hypothetical protein [Pirellulaceae bacterium]